MEEIFEAVKQAALIHKTGGGTGFSFSRLRPAGDPVKRTGGSASGPCSFIHAFDAATETVKQGSMRRGANMGALRVDHPDIMEFISLKREEGKLSNFNLSVGITDLFIEALKADKDFDLVFGGKVRKTLKAKEIWNAIVDGAWQNGEPGVIFLDTINRFNPTPHLGKIEGTNPCGETPLLPYEACVLGSINLSKMVRGYGIDFGFLGETVRTAVRFLDNVIDFQHYPLPEVEKAHKGNRKIGLGVMGFADMLIRLGIPYNSDESLGLAEKIMGFVTEKSVDESVKLGEEKDAFPNWEGSIWQARGLKIRNATTTTIAPTGSISILAGCSSGIEPVFDWVTVQKRPIGEHKVFHPDYEMWMKENPERPLPSYFITAKEIPFEWHIRMQAAFQRHTHNAVSKTINLPSGAIQEDVSKAFLMAYDLGCKGLTVYRDGSRSEQVISSTVSKTNDLPSVLEAKRVCIETPEGKVYFNISFLDGKPREVFITTPAESKYGEVYESFARVFSVALRSGVPLSKLTSQLEKANMKYGSVVSVPYALVRAFRLLGVNGEAKCPDCGGGLTAEEGCLKCHSCGFSKC
jgi:ribonucleoside-diphosphate reductase alpha chain